jgi:hypothetical protein
MSSGQVSSPSPPGRHAASPPDLARSEGFRVQSPDGFVGVVEAVRPGPSAASDSSELAVHAGRSSALLLIIPSAMVQSVDVVARRVVLRPLARITATERMALPDGPGIEGRTDVDPDPGRRT